jgi:hypothetical protein
MKKNVTNPLNKIDVLLEEVTQIKKVLLSNKEKNEPEAKYLNLSSALVMLSKQGFSMSKSRVYKMTAEGSLPCRRFGNRLVFNSLDLLNWCEGQLKISDTDNVSIMEVVKSAQKMTSSNFKK